MQQFDLRTVIERNRKAYNFLAYDYAKEWVDKPDLLLANEFLKIMNGNKILDVGCGPGHYSSYFIDKGFEVVAIDNSSTMLQIATNSDPRIQTRRLDMMKLDYGDNEFDGLWVCASLPHIPRESVSLVLQNFKRMLKFDGCMLVNAIIGDLEYREESTEEMQGRPGRIFQWYPSPAAFRKILEEAGFKVQTELPRTVTSEVVKNAKLPTNFWYNFFCRVDTNRSIQTKY
jgi:ubiquinone/menaquinone biosynthesis C-methylase UbiE